MRPRLMAIATMAAGLVSACGGESSRFLILQDQVPQNGCEITVDRMVYQGDGMLDVALVGNGDPFGYVLFPLLENDFPAAMTPGSPEPNRLFVRAFRVRVEAGDGAPAAVSTFIDQTANAQMTAPLVEFQEPWSGTIEPGGGLMAAGVGVIPGDLARLIRSKGLTANGPIDLRVRVNAVGHHSQGDVQSADFVFPIKVCERCLIANLRACPYAPANFGNACNLAQDAPVDCCQDGAQMRCGPAVGM